ncbi:hypothetical protein EVAR_103021_1 [Eumeta japonica]|uniref:Uncharacterized protein n=1 Tax=Eumeta variegata TaxID=151549 RepID=A0A4C1WBA2_EUMVA|nr:hypothetical protein EVAR_103021_1 [Eumeta japonica]
MEDSFHIGFKLCYVSRPQRETKSRATASYKYLKRLKTAHHASATSATADGLAPEGASQTKKFCLPVIKKRPRKKFCLQVIKKRPRKPDVADVHEWCSAATDCFLSRTN